MVTFNLYHVSYTYHYLSLRTCFSLIMHFNYQLWTPGRSWHKLHQGNNAGFQHSNIQNQPAGWHGGLRRLPMFGSLGGSFNGTYSWMQSWLTLSLRQMQKPMVMILRGIWQSDSMIHRIVWWSTYGSLTVVVAMMVLTSAMIILNGPFNDYHVLSYFGLKVLHEHHLVVHIFLWWLHDDG